MDLIRDLLRRPTFWYLVLILFVMGLVGNMDYQDEVAEANAYCQNVAEGVWPDYNGTYDRWCEDGRRR